MTYEVVEITRRGAYRYWWVAKRDPAGKWNDLQHARAEASWRNSKRREETRTKRGRIIMENKSRRELARRNLSARTTRPKDRILEREWEQVRFAQIKEKN